MAAAATDGAPGGRSRKFFGQVTFTPSKRGYEQAEVDAFLEQAGHAIERLLQRLREAEALAGDARTQIESAETRAQRAEAQLAQRGGDDDLIQRTLTLAERTAVAAVADAKARAEQILQEANLEAADLFAAQRREVEVERATLADERQQLEALRLAVAAESHALDQVRANLRDRVAAVARELETVADAPDLLGYKIAGPTTPTTSTAATAPTAPSAVAEVVAPAPLPVLDAPPAPAPAATVEPPALSTPAPQPATELLAPVEPAAPVAPTSPADEPPVLAPSVATAAEPVTPVASAPDPTPPTPVGVEGAAVPPGWGQPPTHVAEPGAVAEAVHPKSFEAQWEQEQAAADPAADQAFAQFFSDKVEQDPSQTWLQQPAEAS